MQLPRDSVNIGDDAGGTAPPGQTLPEVGARPARTWVPVRSLSERHRPRILAHLLALASADRYLRFGHAASDAHLARYVELIDFSRDAVFGIFNRRLELVATAHLASLPQSAQGSHTEAEFGVSVLAKARGRGHGGRLFDHAALHARNRQVDTLIAHVSSENTAMLRIAHGAGATVEREGSESLVRLRLPPDDVESHVDALVEGRAAEFDYGFKVRTHGCDGLLKAIDAVKGRLTRAHRSVSSE